MVKKKADILGTLPDWAIREYIKKGIIKYSEEALNKWLIMFTQRY